MDVRPTPLLHTYHPHSNMPGAITIGGYICAAIWLAGGHWVFAFASIGADELDGYVARRLGDTTEYGSELDWAVDITLTGAVAMRLGIPWALPVITPFQVARRLSEDSERAPGSVRAVMMLSAIGLGK